MKKLGVYILFIVLLASCGSDDGNNGMDIEDPVVEVNVLSFVYIPPVNNTPERLVYDIELTNTSNVDAQGGLRVTTRAEGLESTTIPTSSGQCYQIPANTTCLYSFDETGVISLPGPSEVVFVSAEYVFF